MVVSVSLLLTYVAMCVGGFFCFVFFMKVLYFFLLVNHLTILENTVNISQTTKTQNGTTKSQIIDKQAKQTLQYSLIGPLIPSPPQHTTPYDIKASEHILTSTEPPSKSQEASPHFSKLGQRIPQFGEH